ncbi:zinc ribbon domain-containing protein [Dysosmobacter sp. Phy]
MNFWEAAFMAAMVTVTLIGFAANKILDVDFTVFFRRNWKSTKCRKMLAQRKGPWQGTTVQGEIRRAFDLVLLPLGKADKGLLPARMDRNFRRRMEGQIELLERRKLCREIRMTDIIPLPKNAFRHWSDDGREWRESVLQCSALERLLPKEGGRPVHTVYRKNARLRLLQSRHIRSCDRAGKQKSYYADKATINCPSCGAEVELRSQQTVCPYCGGVIQSDFYDWQTESFGMYEQMGANQEKALWLLAWGGILYVCLFLCLWLIQDAMISLAVGVGAAVLILAAVIAVSTITYGKQEKLEQEIVRYSENYLRSCISEALYPEGNHPDRMDYSVGTIRLKQVVNTEETTTITVQVYISETHLPQGRKPHTRKYKRTLVLQRARYPQRRKQDGKLFTERECPSCGANFVPDENHCCTFCGYSFRVDSAKWVVQTDRV